MPIYVLEDSASSSCIRLDDRTTSSGFFSVFEKNPESFADTNWEESLQPSGRVLNKEKHEAYYEKAVPVYRPDALSLRPDTA
jgi:hypothetical protein